MPPSQRPLPAIRSLRSGSIPAAPSREPRSRGSSPCASRGLHPPPSVGRAPRPRRAPPARRVPWLIPPFPGLRRWTLPALRVCGGGCGGSAGTRELLSRRVAAGASSFLAVSLPEHPSSPEHPPRRRREGAGAGAGARRRLSQVQAGIQGPPTPPPTDG